MIFRRRREEAPPPPPQPPAERSPQDRLEFMRIAFPSWEIDLDDGIWVATLKLKLTDRRRAAGVEPVIRHSSHRSLGAALSDQSMRIILDKRLDRTD